MDAQGRHDLIVDLWQEPDTNFVEIGKQLFLFSEKEQYLDLGITSLNAYLASPIFPCGRTTAYRFKRLYKLFVVELKCDRRRLLEVGQGKLALIVKCVTSKNVRLWLQEARRLSRRELKGRIDSEFDIKDANHDDIADLFHNAGWEWVDTYQHARFTPGFPDALVIDLSGKTWWVEIKYNGASLRDAQSSFHQRISAAGANSLVLESTDAAKEFLEKHK